MIARRGPRLGAVRAVVDAVGDMLGPMFVRSDPAIRGSQAHDVSKSGADGLQVARVELARATAQTSSVDGAHLITHRDAARARGGRGDHDRRSRGGAGREGDDDHRGAGAVETVRRDHGGGPRLADFSAPRGVEIDPPDFAAPDGNRNRRRGRRAHGRRVALSSGDSPSPTVVSQSESSTSRRSSRSTSSAAR